MKTFLLGIAMIVFFALPSPTAHAVFRITVAEVNNNVVINGIGSINLSALTSAAVGFSPARIEPSAAFLLVGPTSSSELSLYNGGGLTGPNSFGSGGSSQASSGSGSLVGAFGGADRYIFVPQGYVSGSQLTSSSVYIGQTFTSLGYNPGTYTYTWGSGATADSLVIISAVPEPSTLALLGLGALGVYAMGQRCRRMLA